MALWRRETPAERNRRRGRGSARCGNRLGTGGQWAPLCALAWLLLAAVAGPLQVTQAAGIECISDSDCGIPDKRCHENRCICKRARPIEDQDRCLPLTLINEPCSLDEQCLGNSRCLDGLCSCGNDAISSYNPSAKIFYCHPKRRLNEDCNYDSQCPANAYCSTKSNGCLCLNGYLQAIVSSAGGENFECLPKLCSSSANCESEYHECQDEMCKCLATHFDPHTAKCYRFGSMGGKKHQLLDGDNNTLDTNATEPLNKGDNTQAPTKTSYYINSILEDLMKNSDRFLLASILVICLSIFIILIIFFLLRRHYLGYCWTAHKKEYEPNNKNGSNNHFNKNSINNKSFRQKNSAEQEQGNDDSLTADKSNLMGTAAKNKPSSPATSNSAHSLPAAGKATNASAPNKHLDKHKHGYVKVNINENLLHGNDLEQEEEDEEEQGNRYHGQQQMNPLATSTSTPV